MVRTVDRSPGEAYEEGMVFDNQPAGYQPPDMGGMRLVDGVFQMRDALGVFNPRDGGTGLPPATAVGQVLFSCDGATFTVETPLTSCDGWLTNNQGELIVVG